MRLEDKVLCPQCVADGTKSTVRPWSPRPSARSEFSNPDPHYDEEGDFHDHDRNEYEQGYTCSRYHTWRVLFYTPCLTCGWDVREYYEKKG